MRNVKWWIRKGDISFLEYAAQNGLHNIRRDAIIGLGILNSKDSESILTDAIDDSYRSVSLAAIDALKNMNRTPELNQRMEEKEKYWAERTIKNKPAEKWKSKMPKWERNSKKTFENVKELLRKPVNIGKWF